MSYEPREFQRHILAEAEHLAALGAALTRTQFDEHPTIQQVDVTSSSRAEPIRRL